MKLLALDTAATRCSVALLLDGEVRELDAPAERVQAESVLPMVERLLADAGMVLQNLDALAFGRGPGAFTGLRVAAAVTQGLAYGAGLPVVPVSNLAALAAAAGRCHGARRVLACLDARMGEIYWGAFTVDPGAVSLVGTEQLSPPADFAPPVPGPWFGAGSAWGAYGGVLHSRAAGLLGADAALAASAGDIARLGARSFERGEALPAERAVPVYLRDKVASPKL